MTVRIEALFAETSGSITIASAFLRAVILYSGVQNGRSD
jgi:hypothetical protein